MARARANVRSGCPANDIVYSTTTNGTTATVLYQLNPGGAETAYAQTVSGTTTDTSIPQINTGLALFDTPVQSY